MTSDLVVTDRNQPLGSETLQVEKALRHFRGWGTAYFREALGNSPTSSDRHLFPRSSSHILNPSGMSLSKQEGFVGLVRRLGCATALLRSKNSPPPSASRFLLLMALVHSAMSFHVQFRTVIAQLVVVFWQTLAKLARWQEYSQGSELDEVLFV